MQWCYTIFSYFHISLHHRNIIFSSHNDTEQRRKNFVSKEGWMGGISIASTHHTGMQLTGCYSSVWEWEGYCWGWREENGRSHLSNQCVTSGHILANALRCVKMQLCSKRFSYMLLFVQNNTISTETWECHRDNTQSYLKCKECEGDIC